MASSAALQHLMKPTFLPMKIAFTVTPLYVLNFRALSISPSLAAFGEWSSTTITLTFQTFASTDSLMLLRHANRSSLWSRVGTISVALLMLMVAALLSASRICPGLWPP